MENKTCETCANWTGEANFVGECTSLFFVNRSGIRLLVRRSNREKAEHPHTNCNFSCIYWTAVEPKAPSGDKIFRVVDNQAMQETVIVMDTDIGEEEYTVPMSYGKTQELLNWLNAVCPYIYKGPR